MITRTRFFRKGEYRLPLPTRGALISQAEMVRRIEAARAEDDAFDSQVFGPIPETRPLPIGRVCEPAFLRRRTS